MNRFSNGSRRGSQMSGDMFSRQHRSVMSNELQCCTQEGRMDNRNVSAFRDAVISITRQSNEQEIELQNVGVLYPRGEIFAVRMENTKLVVVQQLRRLITWQKCAFQANLHFKLMLISHWWDKTCCWNGTSSFLFSICQVCWINKRTKKMIEKESTTFIFHNIINRRTGSSC